MRPARKPCPSPRGAGCPRGPSRRAAECAQRTTWDRAAGGRWWGSLQRAPRPSFRPGPQQRSGQPGPGPG
ncbi:MAG: hypothetical protein CVU73_00875 [Deltaproteobacteria bacterium HGW-Deltaproteobacteria-8]|nr:MAG: hypothetical protein CVU73_00875 [Deltaproteobacteria bacterium HGW-Deltaproteobacteria-8]